MAHLAVAELITEGVGGTSAVETLLDQFGSGNALSSRREECEGWAVTLLMEPRISLKRRKSRETDRNAAAIAFTEKKI